MKLRNILSKVLILATVAVSSMAIGAVSAFAEDTTYTLKEQSSNGLYKNNGASLTDNDSVTVTSTDRFRYNPTTGTGSGGAKFNKEQQISSASNYPSGSKTDSNNKTTYSPYWIALYAEAGDTIKLTNGTKNMNATTFTVYPVTENSGSYTFGSPVGTITTTADKSAISDGLEIQNEGTYLILNTGSSNTIIASLTVTPGVQKTKYTVSGKVTGLDEGETVSIGTNELTVDNDGNYSVDLAGSADGETYDVTVSNDLKEASPASITVNEAAKTVDITVTKKALTTLTGTVDSNLTTTGNIKIGDNSVAIAENGSYSVVLPKNATYTVSLLDNEGYKTSSYEVNETSVTIGSDDTQTFDITGTKITEWSTAKVGKTLPSVTIQRTTGTYKGIYVDASAEYDVDGTTRYGKFDSSSGQVNAKTVLTIPMDTSTKELELTVNNSNKLDYTVVYNDDSAVITIGAPTTDSKYSTYITGIRIVDKVPKTVVEATESTAAYVTYGDKDYAIIVVPASKAADDNNTKITLTFNSEDTAGPTEVYKNVQFGNKTYGADSFGGTSDDYVYGYAVTAADGSTAQAGIAAMTVTIE